MVQVKEPNQNVSEIHLTKLFQSERKFENEKMMIKFKVSWDLNLKEFICYIDNYFVTGKGHRTLLNVNSRICHLWGSNMEG